ncbi:MAG: stage II sporulation protein M [Deltaproteobacteria bacterium]|jgi:hypothetical protein|nr:stage II sporulation protein M [Deltaproteobacteria bacterium]
MTDPSSPRYGTGLRRIAESLTDQPLGVVVQVLYGVAEEDVEFALKEQKGTGGKLGDILVRRGSLSEEQLAACLALLVKKETTFLSHAFLAPLRFKWWGRHAQLTMESLALMLVTFVVVHRLLGLAESGLLAIFLTSAALTTRFNVVLADINTKNEVVDILAMFVGLFMVFVGVATMMDPATIPKSFGFVMSIADMDATTTLYDRSFGNFGGIVVHNTMVLASGVLLSFLYRGYATLLLLAWNAAVWGLTLTLLFRQSFLADGGVNIVPLCLGVAALLPHLLLEATAYILGSISAITVSKSLLWYGMSSRRFRRDALRSLGVLSAAAAMVAVAGALESHWAPELLSMAREHMLPR